MSLNRHEINALLEEWARLAPAEIARGLVNWYLDSGASEILSRLTIRDLDIIQGAVQRALDARGVAWNLNSEVREVGGRKTALIHANPDISIAIADECGAIALLRAYLEALQIWAVEAETEQTKKTALGLPPRAESTQ